MKNYSFLHIISSIIFLALSFNAQAIDTPPAQINWQNWSPDVFTQAEKEGKLVLLDLMAEWCVYCKKMDDVTYRDPQVIETINKNYIAVRADQDKHPKLAQRYKNYGRPATVVYNSKGTEVIKRRGYIEPQILFWMLDTVAANPDPAAHR